MQALIAGQGPVPATQEEADEVLAWCRDGSGVCQFRSVLPSRAMSSGPSRLCAALPRGVTPETARHASPGRTELETTVRMVTPLS
jgi:hypothetical protein